jgi:hypothetical protein
MRHAAQIVTRYTSIRVRSRLLERFGLGWFFDRMRVLKHLRTGRLDPYSVSDWELVQDCGDGLK